MFRITWLNQNKFNINSTVNTFYYLSEVGLMWLLQGEALSEDANCSRDTPQRSDSKRWSASQTTPGVQTRNINALEIAAEQVTAQALHSTEEPRKIMVSVKILFHYL